MGIFDKITKLGTPLVEDTEESVEIEQQEKRYTGKIIKVDSRGFGFITTEELPFERIFFHWTSLRPGTLKFPALRKGMRVSFVSKKQEPDSDGKDKGLKAIRVIVED